MTPAEIRALFEELEDHFDGQIDGAPDASRAAKTANDFHYRIGQAIKALPAGDAPAKEPEPVVTDAELAKWTDRKLAIALWATRRSIASCCVTELHDGCDPCEFQRAKYEALRTEIVRRFEEAHKDDTRVRQAPGAAKTT